MDSEFDISINGYKFHVSCNHLGFVVSWLDFPDETYPSGFSVFAVEGAEGKGPFFDKALIAEEIKEWLEIVLSDRV